MGKEYAKTHKGLERLAKIYDFAAFKYPFFLPFLLDKNKFF